MVYGLEIPPDIEKNFNRLLKKDRALWGRIEKLLDEILQRPNEIGSPKKYRLKGYRGHHMGPFVLLWSVDEKDKKVRIVLFEHHDDAY